MRTDDEYIVKSTTGIAFMKVLAETTYCVKIKWRNGIEEWVYKTDFKSLNSYVDPKKMILQRINISND